MLKEILSLIKWIFSGLITRLVFIVFVGAGVTLYYQYRQGRREQQPVYVNGIITDRFDREQKAYFQYKFEVNNKIYISAAYRSLCQECKGISCVVGDSLLIEYRKDNPGNNSPVCNR